VNAVRGRVTRLQIDEPVVPCASSTNQLGESLVRF